jgi:UDPglucose 6-dehydrogenase
MKISVFGAGYVGLVTGACFADLGHRVLLADIDRKKIAMLRKGKIPIFEPGLDEVVKRNARQGRLVFTTEQPRAVRESDILFIAVGTPPLPNGEADQSQVKTVAKTIGTYLNGDKIIVNKSTVPVGMGDLVASIVREQKGGRHKFSVVSNPEFLREGNAVHDFMNPDRIVIGASDPRAADMVAQLFRPLNARITMTDVRSAEMIKYASNAFLACKISFINEIAALCDRVGADVNEVAAGMGQDRRIGAAFLSAGAGFGGSCFPKDTLALISVSERESLEAKLLRSVVQVNAEQRKRMLEKVKDAVGPLEGRLIAVWGLAFKANTDDMREAVSVDIIGLLRSAGARIKAYDPAAMANARRSLPGIAFARDPYDAVRDADGLLILTEWNEFKEADLGRVKSLMRKPAIIDGRNIFDLKTVKALGFTYRGVGRSA